MPGVMVVLCASTSLNLSYEGATMTEQVGGRTYNIKADLKG